MPLRADPRLPNSWHFWRFSWVVMRIIYLHQYFNTPSMVGGTRSYEMARRFVAAGHEVHVVTTRREGVDGRAACGWTMTVEAGIHVHWLDVPYSNAMGASQRIVAFLRFALRAALYSVTLGGDVVFATSTPLTIAIPGIYAHLRLRRPLVLEVRDLWPEIPIAIGALKNPLLRGAARALEWAAYRCSTEIVALSPGMRDGIVARGYPIERVTIVPNGSDNSLFESSPNPGRSIRFEYPWLGSRSFVLYAGTIGFMNGVQYLVRLAAAARTAEPELRFVVIGDGAQRDVVADLAAKLGVLDTTFFMLSSMAKVDIVEWYCAATVVASLFIDLPAMRANSANKFFDGLAAGRPVAINYEGWQADLLRDEGAGIVLPPTDHGAAAEMLVEFVRSPGRLQDAGSRARNLAETRFDRDRLAREVLDVLEAAAQL